MFTGGPEDKPAFLSQSTAEAITYPGADTPPNFDHELNELPPLSGDNGNAAPFRGKGASRGYQSRWSEIARLHALGYTNNQIGRHLGYSPSGISLALDHDFTQSEVARWRATLANQTAIDRVKDAALDSVSYMHKVVADERQKTSDRMTAAQWLAEKSLGKAKQEVAVEHGIGTFIDLMRQMQSRGETIDTAPRLVTAIPDTMTTTAPKHDHITTWLDENL